MLRSAIAALALLLGSWTYSSAGAATDPTRIELVDQRGSAFTLHALQGTPTIVTFVACPMSDALFEHLAQTHVAAHLVTITLDPGYDTPFVMAQYARTLGADVHAWRVASGTPARVNALLDSLGVDRPRVTSTRPPDVHSTAIYCLDRAGRLAKTVLLSDRSEADVRAWLRATS